MDAETKELLTQAAKTPKGLVVEEFNPSERYPRVAVGDGFDVGQTISGYFDTTLTVASAKFKYGEGKNEQGLNTKSLHVLRIGSPTGPRLGIWGVTDLNNALDGLAQGTFISITYKGKGENAQGNSQHFFEYKRQVTI